MWGATCSSAVVTIFPEEFWRVRFYLRKLRLMYLHPVLAAARLAIGCPHLHAQTELPVRVKWRLSCLWCLATRIRNLDREREFKKTMKEEKATYHCVQSVYDSDCALTALVARLCCCRCKEGIEVLWGSRQGCWNRSMDAEEWECRPDADIIGDLMFLPRLFDLLSLRWYSIGDWRATVDKTWCQTPQLLNVWFHKGNTELWYH